MCKLVMDLLQADAISVHNEIKKRYSNYDDYFIKLNVYCYVCVCVYVCLFFLLQLHKGRLKSFWAEKII